MATSWTVLRRDRQTSTLRDASQSQPCCKLQLNPYLDAGGRKLEFLGPGLCCSCRQATAVMLGDLHRRTVVVAHLPPCTVSPVGGGQDLKGTEHAQNEASIPSQRRMHALRASELLAGTCSMLVLLLAAGSASRLTHLLASLLGLRVCVSLSCRVISIRIKTKRLSGHATFASAGLRECLMD